MLPLLEGIGWPPTGQGYRISVEWAEQLELTMMRTMLELPIIRDNSI